MYILPKDKHKRLLERKKEIIRKYNDNILIKEIAEEYSVKNDTIYKWLRKWGVRKRSGIRYLLGKMILEGDLNGIKKNIKRTEIY